MKQCKDICLTEKFFTYSGRIDWKESGEPVFVYPCTSLSFRVIASECSITLTNTRQYWNSYLGVCVDGNMKSILLEDGQQTIILFEEDVERVHSVMIYKRMDACHYLTLHSIKVNGTAQFLEPNEKPKRRIEVYGDSVSAGELSEAVEYVGKTDPEHNGEYSNSYYSYAWMAARKLNASIHDIAQGGIALLDHTGWFDAPSYIGMESVYDKVQYNPYFGSETPWDFTNYIPHVVIVAIGQNDSHPYDYMKEEYDGEKAENWRAHYMAFIKRLRYLYKDAMIILSTTILEHDASWDRAIDQVSKQLNDEKVVHFLYSNNGAGTPGHIRTPEAQQMSEELSKFITLFGDEIWED